MKKTLIVIAGPTAVGKTEIAIRLAQYFNTSIVSADSRQCYREMRIGTAVPEDAELQTVPHFFIHSHSVLNSLNVGDYEELALNYLEQIFQEKDVAVLVGGTGLYIKALCEGIDEMPTIEKSIQEEVSLLFENKGIEGLQFALKEEDPEFYEKGEVQNPHRAIRALSFKRSVGTSILNYRTGKIKNRPFQIVKIALELPRTELYECINQRVEKMMQEGLLDEVKGLHHLKHLKNLQTVGYTELFDYIDGEYSLDTAVQLIQQHSRNYAKRQLTWLRKDKEFHWFSPKDYPQILQKVKDLLPSL